MPDVTVKTWTRKGFFYIAEISWLDVRYEPNSYTAFTVTRKLGFFSYHFIRWIHGEEGLREMASKIPKQFL